MEGIKILIFRNIRSKRNTLAHNTRILKLLVVASAITLKRENYQKRYGLTLLKQAGEVYSSKAFLLMFFLSVRHLIYFFEVIILTSVICLC